MHNPTRRVVVVTAGGTIASTGSSAGHRADVGGAELLAAITCPPGIDVEVRDAGLWNGFAMRPSDMAAVTRVVHQVLADPLVDGVVVTHGTDTTEETAFLLDLFHDDPRPVVVTGAQRPADDPAGDGPGNVARAISAAADPRLRDTGVLVSFDRSVFAARGLQKWETLASQAFSAPSGSVVARWDADTLHLVSRPVRPAALPLAPLRLDDLRVDIVACYPGADATALLAHLAAGTHGLVIQATGAGNAGLPMLGGVRQAIAEGLPVVLSTRVPHGPVAALYGNGGGVDLVAAGALPSGLLRPAQARMLLLALLGVGTPHDQLPARFAELAGTHLPASARVV